MFNHIHEDMNNFGRELRLELIRKGLEDAQRRIDAQLPGRRQHRFLTCLKKLICWAIIICAGALILNRVCSFCTARKEEKEADDQKELYRKLSRIKGRTAR